jgi:hypothetical protein
MEAMIYGAGTISWSIAEFHTTFCNPLLRPSLSDMDSMQDAQGKLLEQLMGDRIHLLTERVQ